jgi:hypothetical protein
MPCRLHTTEDKKGINKRGITAYLQKGTWLELNSRRVIFFSLVLIPEPGTFTMLAFGGVGVWLTRRKRIAQQNRLGKE